MSRFTHFMLALVLVTGCAPDEGALTETSTASQDMAMEEAPPPSPAPMPGAQAGRAADSGGGSAGIAGDPAAPVAPNGAPVALPDSALRRRLLRTADVGLLVDNVAETRVDVSRLVQRSGGFVAAENETRSGEQTSVHLTLRVPAARFDEVLSGLTADDDAVQYRNVQVEDVTDTMVDLESRLRARRAVRDRYIQLLAQADDVGEILAVEAQMAAIQESIEAAEGQLRGLSDRVSLATIELSVSDGTPGAFDSGPSFWRRLGEAFSDGLDGMGGFVLGIVVLWPMWLIGAALFFLLRPVLRRRRVRREAIPKGPVTPA